MCGLVGIAGNLEFRDEATMKRMLIYDFFRGPDSTGFAALRKGGDVKLAKLASHPIDLFDMKSFQDALSGYNSYAFIGHNRFATKGKVNGKNAHPFQFGNIVGAHNGTLDGPSWDRLTEVIGYKTDVDSEAIFAAIEKIGPEDTIKLLTEGRTSTDGAWALTWFDADKGSIHFLRNKHRPLWYGYTKNFDRIFWASEWQTIDMATKLSLVSPYEIYIDKDGYRFWEMQEDWLYSFDLKELREGSEKRPKARAKELKGREPAPAYSNQGTPPFIHGQINAQTSVLGYPTGTGTTSKTPAQTTGATSKVPEILVVPHTVLKPLGDYMTREQFEGVYARYGCSWCKEKVTYGTPGIVIYEMTGHVLCPKCNNNGEQTRIYTHQEEIKAFARKLAEDKLAAVRAA